MENRQTVQIGEISGGGRAEAKSRTATAGADPEPAKSLVNAAKLREALEFIKLASDDYEKYGNTKVGALDVIYEKACAALAAPPRNCDVGTAAEQVERWHAFCAKYDDDCTGCPCDGDARFHVDCFAIWAQMPNEEGGADADKS
jgi:hypothetical protein